MKAIVETVCREPFRLFFPLGVLMGTVGLSPWLFYAFGVSKTYSGFFHSSIQGLVYMNCFIIGFLTTFIPRFTGTRHASKPEVLSFLLLLLGMTVFFLQQSWVIAEGCYIVWLLLFAGFIVKRIPKRSPGEKRRPPFALIWIPVAILHGVIGTGLLILGQWNILPRIAVAAGKPMMEQGFLLSVVIGIGGFLIPRILGTYQQEAGAVRRTVLFHDGCAAGLFLSFWLEGMGHLAAGYGLRAFVITVQFFRAKTLPLLPKGADFHVRLAWTAAWMMVAGYWMAAVFSGYHVLVLHVAFIGGFSLMTFAIGTMVVMSHAGAAERLRRPLWVLWVVALGIAFAALKRIIVVLYPDAYFRFLGTASILWIITAFCWLGYMIPYFLRIPREDEFEKMHEEAKKRLAES